MFASSPFRLLTDREIEELACTQGLMKNFDSAYLSGCAYDLRAGVILRSRNRESTFDLTKSEFHVESGECITLNSFEDVDFRKSFRMAGSQDLAITAIIMNKHSLVAWGLFHPTTAVDPGFKGSLALTFFNLGSTSLRIKYQDPVAKVMFFCSPESERKYGVNQSPRYREGSTDLSLIVDRSPEEMSDSMLRKMYGAPVRRLYDAVATLAAHKDVLHIKSEEKRKEEKASERRSFSADLMIAFFGAILALGLPALWTAAQSWLLSVKIAP